MLPGILSGHIDIEGMMSVLDHGNAQALLLQLRDRPRQQGRLAGAAPSREAYHFHYILRTPASPRHCEERSDEAIHSFFARRDGLLRFARNDAAGSISFILQNALYRRKAIVMLTSTI
jgi:hypothetical protein